MSRPDSLDPEDTMLPDDPDTSDWYSAPNIPTLKRVTVAVRQRDPSVWDDTTARLSYTAQLAAYLRARPYVFIPATTLERFGRQAWRTRLSEARRGQYRGGYPMHIENRQRRLASGAVISEYRYRP